MSAITNLLILAAAVGVSVAAVVICFVHSHRPRSDGEVSATRSHERNAAGA